MSCWFPRRSSRRGPYGSCRLRCFMARSTWPLPRGRRGPRFKAADDHCYQRCGGGRIRLQEMETRREVPSRIEPPAGDVSAQWKRIHRAHDTERAGPGRNALCGGGGRRDGQHAAERPSFHQYTLAAQDPFAWRDRSRIEQRFPQAVHPREHDRRSSGPTNFPHAPLRPIGHHSVHHPPCAPAPILCAALKAIRSYRNIGITLRRPGRAERDLQLTNLALLKNPNVSGSFRYDAIIPPDDGLLHAYLFTGMNKPRLLRLLLALSKGLTPPAMRGPGIESFNESSLIVAAARPFALEFDGEVVATSFAQFGVLHRHLRVCRS